MAFAAANLLGLAAFVWPLLLGVPATGDPSRSHAVAAPVLLALLVPLLVLTAVDEARARGVATPGAADARLIALLGALVAVNAFLRIPKGPTGEGFVFILPILAGWYIGGRFAYLFGAFSMLASAVLTGGVGPWLPFQMLALAWVGAGAALARRLTAGRLPVPALGVYALTASVAYGFLMTLWFWPFLGEDGPLYFTPGLGLAETLVRYARFYVLTSLPWDAGRALLQNVPLVAVLAVPVGTLFARTRERLTPRVRIIATEPVEAAAQIWKTR